MSTKFFNEAFQNTSANNKPLVWDEESLKAKNQFLIDLEKSGKVHKKPAGVIAVMNLDNKIYCLFCEPLAMANRVRKGKKVNCPVGKNQLIDLINSNSEYIEYMGTFEEFLRYRNNIKIKGNNGTPMQKWLSYKWHTTTNTTAKLANGGDGIIRRGRVNEVKFFDWTKTTGTPSATRG
jgi:hypothetical protein